MEKKDSKKCPVCGKNIAAKAQYCIFCSSKFDESSDMIDEVMDCDTDEQTKQLPDISPNMQIEDDGESPSARKPIFLVLSIASFLVICAIITLILLNPFERMPDPTVDTDEEVPVVTTTTRDAARDQWLQTFLGEWYDELSVGKKDIRTQGGHHLYIHSIEKDTVVFDVVSYSNDPTSEKHMALAMGMKAELNEDTLHFTFLNDGCNHSGEGFMRLSDDGVEMEVIIDEADVMSENEHSLAIYSVFHRRSVPASSGYDLKDVVRLEDIKAIAGVQIAEPVSGENGLTTYHFQGLTVVADQDGKIRKLSVDYNDQQDKTVYCYDAVDGTATYDVVKTYFGEATQDYVEQPTNIRVLRYLETETVSLTFTFDAENNLLMHIEYAA